MRLAGKLVLTFIAVIVAVLAVDTLLLLRNRSRLLEAGIQVDVKQLGRVVRDAVLVASERDESDVALLVARLNQSSPHIGLKWAQVNAAGQELQGLALTPDQVMRLAAGEDVVDTVAISGGGRGVVAYVPVHNDGRFIGVIEVSHSLAAVDRYAALMTRRGLVLSCIMIVTGAGVAIIVGLFMVARPLQRLIAHTRRIGEGDLSRRIELSRGDELGELSRAINEMCERLERARSQLEQETGARISALEQLRHADRLNTVGHLAAGVAHEMGTPLNVISGRAAMLATDSLTPQEIAENAAIIRRQSDRITRIIRSLLDFSRRSLPDKRRSDLRSMLIDTVEMLAPMARKAGVQIELALTEPHWANVDPGQMQQVFTNLIVNAIQAMPSGGLIQLRVAACHALPPNEVVPATYWWQIEIEDTGVGIDPEHLSRIFDPFFTTKEIGQGTGLGLSIAYGIVREHGGWIAVRSTPGKATVFTVYLPREDS